MLISSTWAEGRRQEAHQTRVAQLQQGPSVYQGHPTLEDSARPLQPIPPPGLPHQWTMARSPSPPQGLPHQWPARPHPPRACLVNGPLVTIHCRAVVDPVGLGLPSKLELVAWAKDTGCHLHGYPDTQTAQFRYSAWQHMMVLLWCAVLRGPQTSQPPVTSPSTCTASLPEMRMMDTDP